MPTGGRIPGRKSVFQGPIDLMFAALIGVCIILGVVLVVGMMPQPKTNPTIVILGEVPRTVTTYSANGNANLMCLNGVQYWKFGSLMSPKYSPGFSLPDLCDGTEKTKHMLKKGKWLKR
ncbi:hypothetical protein LCGC14_1069370 [marine sediment metagenome]|uniref:Uncharacterized protein n=1 Tax=marine sediment metagenome TaxID=412755 RepID=A0A0F9MIS0_9ZZZZ